MEDTEFLTLWFTHPGMDHLDRALDSMEEAYGLGFSDQEMDEFWEEWMY